MVGIEKISDSSKILTNFIVNDYVLLLNKPVSDATNEIRETLERFVASLKEELKAELITTLNLT